MRKFIAAARFAKSEHRPHGLCAQRISNPLNKFRMTWVPSQRPTRPLGAQAKCLCSDRADLFFELLLALIQRSQTQLPAMQLNAELVNVTGHFRPLGFVFCEAALNMLDAHVQSRS
jgi:hypothetical protein